jgi:hypothetical protein
MRCCANGLKACVNGLDRRKMRSEQASMILMLR